MLLFFSDTTAYMPRLFPPSSVEITKEMRREKEIIHEAMLQDLLRNMNPAVWHLLAERNMALRKQYASPSPLVLLVLSTFVVVRNEYAQRLGYDKTEFPDIDFITPPPSHIAIPRPLERGHPDISWGIAQRSSCTFSSGREYPFVDTCTCLIVLQRRQFDASVQTEYTTSSAQTNPPDNVVQTVDLDATYVEEDSNISKQEAKDIKNN